SLGRFTLSDIPPAPRGVPQIEVTFDIDANGILNVKAKDKGTNKEQAITITASTNLDKEEVERMKKDAEAHAEEDKKRRESVEVKNMAETMIYTTEKMLKDAGDKAKEEDKKVVEEKMEALKAIKDGDDIEAIKKAADELATEAQKVGAALYQDRPEAEVPPTSEGEQAESATPEPEEPKAE
ncbi:MAG: Hsp70 family protein, partial [Candidatus Magasanikbacteria bacterium]|nr:Hsp70 family protein [Candidatus Magasanikbacteria bacterium]